MSDAVEILLSVNDQATDAIQNAAKKVDEVEKETKQSEKTVERTAAKVQTIQQDAEKAKPSVFSLERAGKSAGNAISRIGDTLNIPALSQASGEIGGIAEQLQLAKEASQGMKLGFLGTAGVAGGVLTASIGIGKAIGDVVFQTSQWEERLKSALSLSSQLSARQGRMAQQAFGDQLSRLEASGASDASYLELIKQIKREAEGVSRNLNAEMSKLEKMSGIWSSTYGQYETQLIQANVDALRSQLEQLKEQENQVERILTVERELTKERERKSRAESEARFIQQLQQELELMTASAEEQDRIIAARNAATIEGQAAIEMLLQAKRSAQQEVEKAVAKSEQVKKVVEKPRAVQDRFTELDAFESRLLTRGPGQPTSEETKTLREILRELKDQKKLQEKTTQDLSMLIRNPLVIGAPGGRR